MGTPVAGAYLSTLGQLSMRALVRHPLFRILVLATWVYVVLLTEVGFVHWLANAIAFLVLLTPALRSIWIDSLLILLLPLLFYIDPSFGLDALPTLLYFFLLTFILRSERAQKPRAETMPTNLHRPSTTPLAQAPAARHSAFAQGGKPSTTHSLSLAESAAAPSFFDESPISSPSRQQRQPLPAGERQVLRAAWAFVCVALGMTLITHNPLNREVGLTSEPPRYHSYLQPAEIPERTPRASLTGAAATDTEYATWIKRNLDVLTFQVQPAELSLPTTSEGRLDYLPIVDALDQQLALSYAAWQEGRKDENNPYLITPQSEAKKAQEQGELRSAYLDLFTFRFQELQNTLFPPAPEVDLVY